MAESRKKKSKSGKVTELPTLQTSTAVLDPPDERPDPAEPRHQTPFDDPAPARPAKNPRGRPSNAQPIGAPPRNVTFFDRMMTIPVEDWGTRVKIRCYRLEPLIDALRGSHNKYIQTYTEPITEEKIKQDQGSGRYRLYMNYKAAGTHGERELDMIEVDILDPRFPPNIPPGTWIDDPRNKNWIWAKPGPQPSGGPNYPLAAGYPNPNQQPAGPQAPAANGVLEGVKLATELRKDVREELKAEHPAPAAAPATIDPWAAAERILNMRSDNPMVAILDKQLSELRESMQRRDAQINDLQKELFQGQIKALEQRIAQLSAAPAAEKKGSLIDSAKEIAELMGVEPKEILGKFIGHDDGGPVKSRMSGTMEFISTLADKFVNSPIVPAVAGWITARASAAPGTAHQPATAGAHQPAGPIAGHQPAAGRPPANGKPSNPAPGDTNEELYEFFNLNLLKPLVEFLDNDDSGDDFAEWVWVGHGIDRVTQLQNITHVMMPGLKGADVMMNLFRYAGNGAIWPKYFANREPQLKKFIDDFCKWREPADENQTVDTTATVVQSGGSDDGPVDLDARMGGNNA